MKTIYRLTILISVMMFLASCQKTIDTSRADNGYLSFSEFSLELDETVITKAVAANGNYVVIVLDSDGNEVLHKNYSEVASSGYKLSVPAGTYMLIARSTDAETPIAEFEQPVYGVSKEFSVVAGQTTTIGELVCTLVQCKVTVAYSDEFLASVTGPGFTKVTVTEGYPLQYNLSANGSYEQQAGYFAVNGSTMTVVFSGDIDNKNQKMTKTFTGVAARQWRQVKFVQKKNEQGDATFDILIKDLISDEVLNNPLDVVEEIIGDDPNAPKGDGGITLVPDYEAGCDSEITDLTNIRIYPVETKDMSIKFKASVPSGVKKFTVDIASDNDGFIAAVDAADARHLDLINPTEKNAIIFTVVPFPHGQDLIGKTEIVFDLSAAQDAIINYKGVHSFSMTIVDQMGCKNVIPVTMVVE